ncbi:1-deoxy-D-xylulose-5-phosphate synthase [Alkaliphilus oremlandii]|uniref:1-deoxy-D-xylulose-5-phosphate synthase n=1 Tax=Alkaliphilus oremlandii (strain OhILAs) TaxID=350688 RepID=DXS_ALKOO|nr:1-deoxy-D-xylulose-5-phosphate synthase [Alkaliphilus oremlandii]A8MFI7.1 RecName: Full=1-deoxy-D-xylulose-5-phosphate synthase; AltName: Full=1-deoxyxylulose-5-phosphate synthase; Short=DXP synthase; Short=DXPS [Alkaliphilus oremlandii OhILAs]ABW19150.1 deoxyxylulose-5-phosphate synthase [Alkaliphilus oremlandii OhILAs]
MYKYLMEINSIEDFKKLNSNEIKVLAEEIRHFLIESVSKTGGHLASNLGVVELTLALHQAFNSPEDKIIWDVGHQAYVHKILTGRRDQFSTLRQYKGLSGFPKRYESEHDQFDTGHSSTSISAAMGLATARDLNKDKYKVIAVIGDGAMTGGMAFEALNHIGQSQKDIIVILNDNEMSISPNVGGLSNYLNKIRTAPIYSKVKDDVEYLISNIPAIGKSVMKTAEKAKDSIKYFFVPGVLFEELGFTYIGPVDGHNYHSLYDVMNRTKNIKGPVLLHVMTTKGKGYTLAEKHPDKYHGVNSFHIETGEPISCNENLSYSEIAGKTLVECAAEDEKIVAITAAMPSGTGLNNFAKKHPERFFDVGIAEQHAATFAAGLAANGFKPFFAVYSTFFQRAYDQVIHDACIQDLPVTYLIDRAGLVGNDGETHHGSLDISFLSCIPNLTFMAPKDGIELSEMVRFAAKHNGPVAIRYPRGHSNMDSQENFSPLALGKGEITYHSGNDVLILALGTFNKMGLEICKDLEENNIFSTLMNPRFIKPMDEELIVEMVQKHKIIYTIEDNSKIGGFGTLVQVLLNDNQILKPVKVCALPDRFIEHGNVEDLYEELGLTKKQIVDQIKKEFSDL